MTVSPALRPRLGALLVLLTMSQAACYDTYRIDNNELAKLQSTEEQREVVVVYADCASSGAAATPKKKSAYRSVQHGVLLAAKKKDTATDAAAAEANARPGCTRVPVSTANSVKIITKDGQALRVTPFNFIMGSQVVSPEYNLLEPMRNVDGAEVKQFSTWKTVATITGITVGVVGTFVLISVLAPESEGFE